MGLIAETRKLPNRKQGWSKATSNEVSEVFEVCYNSLLGNVMYARVYKRLY